MEKHQWNILRKRRRNDFNVRGWLGPPFPSMRLPSISIEAPKNGNTPAEPVSTIVRHIGAGAEMSIRLNAQCTIGLKGDQFLHVRRLRHCYFLGANLSRIHHPIFATSRAMCPS